MRNVFRVLLFLLLPVEALNAQQVKVLNASDIPWWKHNNLRVMQTNLPDYEGATLNPDSLVQDLENFSANTLIINAGGIMAFYPTKLDFQYVNPYMNPNMLDLVVRKCHAKGIRVIVRFDFSRVHESIFRKHPDWCYVSPKGERIINTNMYVVSINAPYVQEKAFKIVQEVITNYAVDGIFLNMPGYQVNNPYEGKYHGIDQNEYDRKRFAEYSHGLQLPVEENKNDPVYRKYLEFKAWTGEEWSERLYKMVKAKNPQIAICTYSDRFVDIIRHESQTNTLPYWPYNASDNVGNAANSFPDHIISNASIQQISFQSRFNAVEPEEVAIRLYENIANGSGLDMSMMGDFRNYEDERNFDVFKRVYGHHKKFESYYGRYKSVAEILVIAPGAWPSGLPAQEYRGIQLMLKESHLQYDILEDKQIGNRADALRKYKLIILPDITFLSRESIQAIREAVKAGVHIMATNSSFSDEPQLLEELFGARIINSGNDGAGNYITVEEYDIFKRLRKQKLLSWKFNLGLYNFAKADAKYFALQSPGRPGPPEITGGHEPMGFYAVGIKNHGKAKAILMPVNIGRLYYIHGYEQNKNIILDLIDHVLPEASGQIITNAPERVEVILKEMNRNIPSNYGKATSEAMILHLINLTGFSGNSYFSPIPVRDLRFRIRSKQKPSLLFSMIANQTVPFTWKDGYVEFVVKNLGEYEGVVVNW